MTAPQNLNNIFNMNTELEIFDKMPLGVQNQAIQSIADHSPEAFKQLQGFYGPDSFRLATAAETAVEKTQNTATTSNPFFDADSGPKGPTHNNDPTLG